MRIFNVLKLIIMTAFIIITSLAGQDIKSKLQGFHIKQLMTASEWDKCGLNKLSSEEIDGLNSFFQKYTIFIVETLIQSTSFDNPDVIESRIDGNFEGWDGETIFKLENGQIWQQSSYAYKYSYKYRPKVLIYKTKSGYKMKVEGVEETIYVKRIK